MITNANGTKRLEDADLVSTGNFNLITEALDTTKLDKAGGTLTGAINLPTNGLKVGTNQIVVNSTGVGIGTDAPAGGLEVFDAKVIFRNTKTAATNNSTRVFGGTYGGASLATILSQDGTSTANNITIGGGTGSGAPATNVIIQTAPYTTTEGNTGITRMTINSAGDITTTGTFTPGTYGQIASGTASVTVGASTTNTVTVTFPVSRFASAPTVTATANQAGNGICYMNATPTTTSVVLGVKNTTAGSLTFTVYWTAIAN